MSKRFKAQDYFRYKRLGKKWRKPRGLQSKLRTRKGGSGMRVSIGYGTPNILKNKIQGVRSKIVSNAKDIMPTDEAIIIASGVGAKKAKLIAEKAKELNVRILNMKKARRALIKAKIIEKKKLKAEKREPKPDVKSDAIKEPETAL